MKKKFTILIAAAFMLLTMMAQPGRVWGQTRTTQTASYGFESGDSGWTTTNFVNTNTDIPAHGGSKYGATNQNSTANVTYNTQVAHPISLTCYYSKTSTNTNSGSHFEIQVSTNNSTWTKVASGLGMNQVTKGTWYELSADLSTYSNVYVRVYYTGTSAIRALDDITLTYDDGQTPSTDPEISFSPASIALGEVLVGNEASTTFSVSQANLTSGITLTVDNGNLSPSSIEQGAAATTITWTYTPTTAGDFIATVTATSGDTSETLEISGTAVAPVEGYDVDFEYATNMYPNWTFNNMESYQTGSITAHGGTYYGTTGGKSTASITTTEVVANPGTLTCYVSKQSGNTTSSTWYIQVSEDEGSTWTNVENHSSTSMSQGEWVEFSADLTDYTDVYVRVYYSGSTAVRNIDDLTLTTASATTVATPVFSPESGTEFGNEGLSVTISQADNKPIYYTLDGSEPTSSSTLYENAINLTTTTTIKAKAYDGENASNVATATYTYVDPDAPGTQNNPYTVAEALAASPSEGVYVTGIISTITEVNTSYHNATYRISDDGSNTNEMIVYRGRYLENADFTSADQIQLGDEVVVTGNLTVYNNVNQLAQGNYLVSLVRKVQTPTFYPEAGAVASGTIVTISCATEGATIYYTTDGSDPTTESTQGTSVTITNACTVKAFAVKEGCSNSNIATAEYTIAVPVATPTFTVAEGTYNFAQSVEIECTTDGATIYYTTNGNDPSTESNEYTEAIVVNETMTIKAIGAKAGSANSEVASATYTMNIPVINASNVNLAYDATNGSIAYTLTNEVEGGVLTAVRTEGDWLTVGEVSAESVALTCTANEGETDRTATVTLTYTYETHNVTKVVTVTQAHFVIDYAELPFEFDGGKSDIESTVGLTQSGLGSDYSSSPKLKFDGTGDWVILKINEVPGTLTFDIKNNSFSGGTFTVQTSEDGATYTDLENYTTITGTQNEEFDNLGENVRYIKWIYTNKSSGNVGLGNIALAQYTVPVPSISADDVAVAYDATSGSIMYTINNYVAGTMVATTEADWISDFTYNQVDEIGEVGFTTAANTGAERSATVTLTYTYDNSKATVTKDVTVTQAGVPAVMYTVNFTLDGGTFVPNEDFTDEIVEIAAGTYNLPSATKAGFDFTGWNDGNTTYEAGAEYTVSTDIDFTAQWTESTTATYELVTSLSDFVSGAHYYIAGKSNLNEWFAMGQQKTNNRQAEAVTVSNNTINQTNNVHEVVISSDNNGFYSIFDEDSTPSTPSSNGYLYAAGGTSNNYLKTYSIDDYDEKGQWTISIDAETNVATITANITGTNVRNNIRFNNGSGIFSCYASGGQSAIYLFKKVDNSPSISADNVNIEYNETSGSIMYTINNYVEGIMFATTTADWISDFTYEQEDEIGEVGFTTTANELYESRSATVTLTYTYEDSKATATKNVIVTQTAAPTPTYTVSFTVGEGGAFVPNEDFTEDIVEIEAGTYTLPSATKAGFEFAGWNDGNTTYEAGAEYTVSADVEFTATYTELPTYTVSFSVNGTIDDNLTVTGSSITLPTSSTLTPEGFSITGWAATNGSAEAIADPYTPTEDITLYAILRQSIPHSMVINASTANFPSSYASWDEYNLEGKNFMIKQGYINTGKLQWRSASHSSGAGTMYNSDDLGKINTIILVYDSSDSNKNFTIKAGTDANPTEGTSIDPTSDGLVYTFDLSSGNYNYFVMTNGDGAGYLQSISIDYVSDLNVNTITYIETTTTLDTDLPATTCIIVESGAVLTFNGDNNGTVDNLIIEDGGQLIHDNLVSATIQRNVTGYGRSNPSGYQFIASPVKDDLNVDETNLTTSGSYDLYIFDQSQPSKEWRNYKANEFTTIGNGVGYLYANNTNITISFSGEFKPSNSDVPVTLAYTDGNRCAGWNLVGNPFACNAYIKGATGGIEAFYRMNANGDGYDAVVGAINPTEGIFVQANAIDQHFYFTRTAPDATPGKGNLNIQVAQVTNSRDAQPATDNAIIRFDNGNALEKFSFSEDNAKLYIPQNGKDYAVVSADAQGELPVYFKAAENGTYTISFSMDNVEFGYLHLIDNKTGNDVDLLQTPSYSFEASTIDYASRFRLVFRAIGNENDSENNDFGFFDANGNFLILGIEGTATLQVMDVTGRTISSETFSGDYSKAINAKAGVYMLRLIQGSNVRTQKIVVR